MYIDTGLGLIAHGVSKSFLQFFFISEDLDISAFAGVQSTSMSMSMLVLLHTEMGHSLNLGIATILGYAK